MAAPVCDVRLRVAALLVDSGQVTLVRHAKDGRTYHLLPGGGVEAGERLSAALVREVREETGLEIEPGRPVLVSDSIAPDGSRHMVQITFAATVTGGTVTEHPADPRVQAVERVALGALNGLDLRPPLADALTVVIDEGSSAPARYVAAPWT